MRTCLSFLVVELMRQGLTAQQACREGIRRMKEELVLSKQSMHDKLTVGIIAMDKHGNVRIILFQALENLYAKVGAASTLDESNDHRGEAFFPVVAWRSSSDEVVTLRATPIGVDF